MTKEFEIPKKIEVGDSITFYCKANDCNVEQKIKDILKEDSARTIEAIKKANSGAAQTTVAVATILFSMAIARLAL